MNSTLRILSFFCLIALLTNGTGLAAQDNQSGTSLAKVDAAGRSVAENLVQTLGKLPSHNGKHRLQIVGFPLDEAHAILGSLWANNLATFLTSAAAIPGTDIVITLRDSPQPDFLVAGELVLAGNTIRIYTRLIRVEDNTLVKVVWSDLALDPVLAGLVLSKEPPDGVWRDMYEPDSRESPMSVGLGDVPVERTLHVGDEDWFMVKATGSGILVVETIGELDSLMSLFSPRSTLPLQEDDDSGDGDNARLEYPVTAGQIVLVKINGYEGDTGRYSFSASLDPLPPQAGRHESMERALQLPLDGESRRQILDAPEKANWYSLTIPGGGGVLQARTTGSLDMLMELYDAQGRKLAEDDDSGEGGNALLSRLLQAGQYYLKLYEYEGNQGIYRLEANLVALGPADQYEPDDTREEAKPITLGSPQNRNFNHPGDIDWALLDLRQAGTYGISARPPWDNGLDTCIELYDAANQLLAEDDDGGRNLDAYLEVELGAGRYYIKVWQLDSEVPGDGSYELLVRIP